MVASFWVPEGELALWEVTETELSGGQNRLYDARSEFAVRAIRAFSIDFV